MRHQTGFRPDKLTTADEVVTMQKELDRSAAGAMFILPGLHAMLLLLWQTERICL
jgi:hypothetical protein